MAGLLASPLPIATPETALAGGKGTADQATPLQLIVLGTSILAPRDFIAVALQIRAGDMVINPVCGLLDTGVVALAPVSGCAVDAHVFVLMDDAEHQRVSRMQAIP